MESLLKLMFSHDNVLFSAIIVNKNALEESIINHVIQIFVLFG